MTSLLEPDSSRYGALVNKLPETNVSICHQALTAFYHYKKIIKTSSRLSDAVMDTREFIILMAWWMGPFGVQNPQTQESVKKTSHDTAKPVTLRTARISYLSWIHTQKKVQIPTLVYGATSSNNFFLENLQQ